MKLQLPPLRKCWEYIVTLWAALVEWCWERLCKCIDSFFRFTVERNCLSYLCDEPAKEGFGFALTTFGVVLSNSIAIAVFANGTDFVSLDVRLVPFALVGVAVMGAQVGLLRTRTSKHRVFSRGSIMFTRWILVWSALLSVVVPAFAMQGWLPGQKLDLNEVSPYTFKTDGESGLRVSYNLTIATVRQHTAKDGLLTLYALLDEETASNFTITTDLFLEDRKLFNYRLSYDWDDLNRSTPRAFAIDIRELTDSSDYRLEFLLKPRSPTIDLASEASRLEVNEAFRIVP